MWVLVFHKCTTVVLRLARLLLGLVYTQEAFSCKSCQSVFRSSMNLSSSGAGRNWCDVQHVCRQAFSNWILASNLAWQLGLLWGKTRKVGWHSGLSWLLAVQIQCSFGPGLPCVILANTDVWDLITFLPGAGKILIGWYPSCFPLELAGRSIQRKWNSPDRLSCACLPCTGLAHLC